MKILAKIQMANGLVMQHGILHHHDMGIVDDKTIVASAMPGANGDKSEAEVAIVIRNDYKHRGMSWTFLKYVIERARQSGIKKLQSIESRQHHAAIELEKEMGFTARAFPGDSTLLLLEFDLLDQPPRWRI